MSGDRGWGEVVSYLLGYVVGVELGGELGDACVDGLVVLIDGREQALETLQTLHSLKINQ